MGDFKPEIIVEKSGVLAIDPRDDAAVAALNAARSPAWSPWRTARTWRSSPRSAC